MEDVGQVSNVSTSAIPKIVQSDFNPSIPVSESSSKKGAPPAMERLSIDPRKTPVRYMGVSIVMWVPQNRWFPMENPI
jgi:hypothetical protein